MNELKSLLRPEIKIQNVVCTSSLEQEIDIASFNQYEFLRSNLKLFKAGYVKDKTMVGIVSVFKNGKLVSLGTKSPEQAVEELEKASMILQKYKLSKYVKIIPQIRNIVVNFDMKRKIPIEKLARTLPKCMYEPEQFAGLIYRMPKSCVGWIFASGKGVIVGTKSINEINSAFFEINERTSLFPK